MRYIVFLLILLISCTTVDLKVPLKRIKIAIVDTGLLNRGTIPFCEPEKDFTEINVNIDYSFGKKELIHGTNISHIVNDIVKDNDQYCQIIIKVADSTTTSRGFVNNTIKALEYLNNIDVDIVNYSAGGNSPNMKEKYLINKLLDKGVIFVAAAGNNSEDLSKDCNFYPACYDDRIVVVGNRTKDGELAPSSNYGKPVVDLYAEGTDVRAGGYVLTGTSQSAAVASGNIIKNALKKDRTTQSTEEEAYKHSGIAFYKQSGTEKFLEEYYKKKTSKDVQYIIEKTLPLSQMLYNKKVQYEWTFK